MHPHLRILLFFFLFYSGVSKAQMVTTVAGTGEMGFRDGPVDTAVFNFPAALALDSVGNIYVSDNINNKIRKIDLSTNTVSTVVGSVKGFSDGNALSACFNGPIGITFAKNGDLFIADFHNSTVRIFHPSTKITEHFAGRPQAFGLRNGKEADVRFTRPIAIAFDKKGFLYISDYENHVIRKAAPDGTVVTYAGNGKKGFRNGKRESAMFTTPTGLLFDDDGNLLVLEDKGNRIRRISVDGNVTTLSGSVAGFRDGPIEQALFNGPMGITKDSSGNIYIADFGNNRIRKITLEGIVSTVAGSVAGYADGEGLAARFHAPDGLQFDRDGNLYVADYYNNRIRKITFTIVSPELPNLKAKRNELAYGQGTEISIFGRLHSATYWAVYKDKPGGELVTIVPRGAVKLFPFQTTTYYVRGEGGGVKPGSFATITIKVDVPYWRSWWFITAALLALVLVGYFITFQRLKREMLKRKVMEFEAKALRAQMNPHFIFNSLNSIQGYIVNNESTKARDYLTRFARLIRKTLDNSRNSMTTLFSETEALKDYLELEKMRFNSNFNYEIFIEEGIDPDVIEIPPMLIQPFVENSILHGVMLLKQRRGHIEVSFQKRGNVLLCVIEDNGIGRSASMERKDHSWKPHESHGTKISAERIKIFQQHYKDIVSIKTSDVIVNEEVAGTRVEISLPYEINR